MRHNSDYLEIAKHIYVCEYDVACGSVR